MSDEEKQKYQKLAEEDRERYRREVTGFEKPLAKDGTRRGRRKKEPGQPKRNMYAPCVNSVENCCSGSVENNSVV